MKRRILAIILVLMRLMTAAASATSESSDNRLETETMTYTYETREIWCQRDDNRIFGIAYVPDAGAEKLPLVIFSHELGNSHTSGIPYAERLAAAGYPRHPYMGNKGQNDTCFKKFCFGISCDRLSSGLLVNPFTYQCK